MSRHAVPGTRRRTTQRRRRREVIAGSGSLTLLLAFVFGVPFALVAIGAFPRTMPSPQQVWTALSTQDDGRLAFILMAALVWVCWGLFVALTVREVGWAIRQRAALRSGAVVPAARPLAGLSVLQRPAATLVAAAAMLFVSSPASVTPAELPGNSAAQASTTMYWTPFQSGPVSMGPAPVALPTVDESAADAVPASSPDAKPALPSYTVRPHDTLWRIAGQHLGNPLRYHDIVALNADKVGPNNKIITGTVLVLPADATDLGTGGAARHVTVHAGDTLSGIAEREGISDWRHVWEANAGRVQPGGERFSDPNLIKPGWQLAIPAAAPAQRPPATVTPPSVPAPQTPALPAPAQRQAPPAQPAQPAQPAHPAQRAEPPRTPDLQPADRHNDPAPAIPVPVPQPGFGSIEASAAAEAQDAGESFPVRTATGIGALLAAAIIGLIALRRGRQQRRRRPGHALPMPKGEAAVVEHDLRTAADPLSVETVDLALRGLAASCHRDGVPLPIVRAGRLTPAQFDLYLAEPAELPAPWVGTADDAVWTLPAGAELVTGIDGEQIPAPYPSLVTIGQDIEDGHVFLDLEYLGALGIKGDPQRSREIMAALAVELASSRWADDLQVTVVGAYPELEDALETGRIRYLPAADHVLDDLAERAERDRRILASAGNGNLNQARAAGTAPGVWTPEIVLIAGEITEQQRARLSDLVNGMPRVAIAAVTSGEPIGDWCLRLDEDTAVLEPIMLWIRPQRIDDHTYGLILDVFGTTDEDAPPGKHSRDWLAEPTLAELPEADPYTAQHLREQLPDPQAVQEDQNHIQEQPPAQPLLLPHPPPRVLVLGPVDVADARGAVEPSKRNRLTELAAFLALNPGVDHAVIDAALWPAARVGHNTRNTAMSKLRRWLGVSSSAEDYLPRYMAESGYQLSPLVRTDWHEWCDLVSQGPERATTEALEQALTLVRGRPFEGVGTRRYAWAENAKQVMISTVVDAAYELARRRLMEGQWRAAEQAVVVGLTLEPGMERLWRVRILAAHLSGNPTAEKEAIDRLLAIAEELGGDLEDETAHLLEELRKPTSERDYRAVRAVRAL